MNFIFILICILSFLMIVDSITAHQILPGESNPIFLFSNIWVVHLLKLIMLFGIWHIYINNYYPSHFWLYSFILILTMSCLVYGLGIYSNVIGMLNSEILESAKSLSVEEKMIGYSSFITVFYLLPIFFSLTAFIIYDKSKLKVQFKKGVKNE